MKNHKLIIVVIAVSILMFINCDTLVRPVMKDVSQSNEINIIEKNSTPEKDRKIWVSLQAQDISSKAHYEWRTMYIPTSLKNAGLNNYEIIDPNNEIFEPSEAEGDYLLIIILNNFMAKNKNSGDSSVTELWLSLTASVYDLPSNSLVIKAGGSATDVAAPNDWNAGEMCCSLLEEMMKNMY